MGILTDLLSIIFPQVCEVCGNALVSGEKHLCLGCLADMPLLDYHNDDSYPFVRRMAAAKITKSAIMFAYVKHSEYARLIQKAKYNNRPELDYFLAHSFAKNLGSSYFADIDLILSVPMHWRKKILRGFNQTDYVARGIAEATSLPVGNNLVAIKGHSTQTRRNAVQRAENIRNVFDVINPEELEGKHLLLVDDVITTGATLLACADAIRREVKNVNISVLALAGARQT